MRRTLALCILTWMAFPGTQPVAAQSQEPPKEQLNLQLPPSPPPAEKPAFVPPEKVFLPGATNIAVVLDTPVSTRITKKGQEVVFLTSESIRLGDGIELPPDTRIVAIVLQAKKPGMFGRPGAMKIKIERIELEGQGTPVVGRLEGVDANAGKITTDGTRAADLYTLTTWSLSGTLMGAQIGGGKGALIGAGAGAAAAILIGMSRRGPDLYLEPGTPFSVVFDEIVELPGAAVYAASQKYEEINGPGASRRREKSEEEMLDSMSDPSRPELKRRPKPPPQP